jgi:hypothetical protein
VMLISEKTASSDSSSAVPGTRPIAIRPAS